MRFLFGQDARVAAWMAEQIGESIHPPYIVFGIVDGNDLRGAVAFNDWNGANIEITLYAPGCFRRHLIGQAYRYVFDQLGCLRLTGRTRRSNARMKRLFPRLGFHYEATLKRYYGPTKADDALIFRLDRSGAQRWMR